MALYGISGGQRRALGSRYRDYAADLALKRLEEEYALAPGREARNLQASQFQQSLAQSGSQFQQNLAQNSSQFQQNLEQQNRQLASQETAGKWATGANLLQSAGMLRALTMNKGEPFFGKTITEGAGKLWGSTTPSTAPSPVAPSGFTPSGITPNTPAIYTPGGIGSVTGTPGAEAAAGSYGADALYGVGGAGAAFEGGAGLYGADALYGIGGNVSGVGSGAAAGAGMGGLAAIGGYIGAGYFAGRESNKKMAEGNFSEAFIQPDVFNILHKIPGVSEVDKVINKVADATGLSAVGKAVTSVLTDYIWNPVGEATGTVICTELARQGFVPWEQIELEHKYHNFDWATYAGYRLWADTVVGWMRKSAVVTRIVKPFGVAFLKEVAHRVEPERKGSWFGSLIIKVGIPICRWNYGRIAGRVVPKEVG